MWSWGYCTVMELIITWCCYVRLPCSYVYGLQPCVTSPLYCRLHAQVKLKGMSSITKWVKLCKSNLHGISMGSSLTQTQLSANVKLETRWID